MPSWRHIAIATSLYAISVSASVWLLYQIEKPLVGWLSTLIASGR